jgi:hypothetical protein
MASTAQMHHIQARFRRSIRPAPGTKLCATCGLQFS